MTLKSYRFKFYLNAMHSVRIADIDSDMHPHTWEIVVYIKKYGESFIQFSETERVVQLYLEKYEEQFLNKIPPFDDITPTMENIGEVLFEELSGILNSKGWLLQKLEISENPSRTYILENDGSHELQAVYVSDVEVPEDIVTRNIMENKDSNSCTQENSADVIQEDEAVLQNEESQTDAFSALEYIAMDLKREEDLRASLKKNIVQMLLCILIIIPAAVGIYFLLTKTGLYPWAEDTWGHMFKAHLLYTEVLKGNYYPLYTDYWYNGIQPFRYWAPLPYYILLVFEIITKGDSLISYNLFVAFIYAAGSIGWVLWGIKIKSAKAGLLFGALWFFLPDNLIVLFVEGNIPRVVVTTIFPYLMLGVWEYLEKRNGKGFIMIAVCMFLASISHIMIAAMAGITLFLFVTIYGFMNKKLKHAIEILWIAIFAIVCTGIWLYPALQGGLMAQDPEAVQEVMKNLTYPVAQSLNPFIRLRNKELFYFGVSTFVISLLGVAFGNKKTKACFLTALVVFLGTTKAAVPVLIKLPLSQLLWMMRFAPMALGIFFIGLLAWKDLKPYVFILFCLFIMWDNYISYKAVFYNKEEPLELKEAISAGVDSARSRIALLDLSKYGSFPSYYFTYNDLTDKHIPQVYGWAWQGAKTAPNIMWINSALENGYYSFMFDRCIELGADTLIVKRNEIKDMQSFYSAAKNAGYTVIEIREMTITLKLQVDGTFGTRVYYEGLAIGKYAPNISYMFPACEVGASDYIEDYSLSDLLQYRTIYLSGFKYRDQKKAEDMVMDLSQKGVKVLIDLTGAQTSILSSRQEFLGVIAQPVKLFGSFGQLKLYDKYITVKDFPKEYEEWNTFFLVNLDKVYGETEFNNQYIDFLGTKYNDNIMFVGLNLPFYTMNTKETEMLKLFEQLTDIMYNMPPKREVINLEIMKKDNFITIEADRSNVITDLSNLDAFIPVEGEFRERHSLLQMKGRRIVCKVGYPYMIHGILTSLAGIAGIIFIYYSIYKRKSVQIND